MKILKDIDKHRISIVDGEKTLAEFGFLADEYTMTFYTDEKIPITMDDDLAFFEGYLNIMLNTYQFSTPLSYQSEDEIVWMSDSYGDIEDDRVCKHKSRFHLEKDSKNLYFSAFTPFLQEKNIHDVQVVAFSPAGNGIYSKNNYTGKSFQDDIVSVHQNLLIKEKEKINAKKRQ